MASGVTRTVVLCRTARRVTTRLLALVIVPLSASLVFADPQARPPVFKAETYVVVYEVSAFKRTWYGSSKPNLDLKAADITIVLEKKLYVPSKLEPDVTRPGYYFLSFTPPEELRDGKPHQVETRIQKGSIKSTATFPKPRTEGSELKMPGPQKAQKAQTFAMAEGSRTRI